MSAHAGHGRRSLAETRAVVERFMRWTIEVERPAAATILPDGEREAFAAYYRRLPAAGAEAMIRRYLRGFWRSEAGWAARWLAARAAGGARPRVLDAGAGFGTYSMLFASVGAEVTGADLMPDRLDAAARRLAFHRTSTGRELAVRFTRVDLTRPWTADYDLVWVHNALSHIDPLERFLAEVRAHLGGGGVLVVADINGGHPSHLRRLAQLRSEVHQEYIAPDGSRHAYAVERPFAPREIRDILAGAGLRPLHHELYWGGLGVVPEPLYAGLLVPLQTRWRLGQRLARRQLVVAGRDDSAGT